MEVKLKPGMWVDPARMQQTVKAAGYKPVDDGVTLYVSGKVVKQGEGLALELDGMKAPLTLPLVAPKDDPDTLVHLREKHVGHAVQLQGRWVAPAAASGPGSLAVDAITGTHDKTKE